MNANCAIHYSPEAFGSRDHRIYGREAASAGFLRGFMRHGGVDAFYCCTPAPNYFETFRRFAADCGSNAPAHWISYAKLPELSTVGALYQPDPLISELAWHRRRLGANNFSLFGVTHSLCTRAIMDAIGALVVAPLENWDALVCTSTSAKAVVEHVLNTYCAYLGARFNTQIRPNVHLPIIPLGVDCDSFAASTETQTARTNIRAQLGIAAEDVAILYVGRLSYHAKAHPLPMYTALEQVAKCTQTRLHLLQFGWFANARLKQEFMAGALRLCPSVRVSFLDEHQDWAHSIWHVGDIFCSLADNLQETFGLTPVEAMAAGLPTVVSDWDGYRETVRHGIDGFRIPTVMPPAGSGELLADRYAVAIDNYDQYVGRASQSVAIDMTSCIAALERLVINKELRTTMAEAAQKRARSMFDWSVIVKAYQELWSELSARRHSAQQQITESRAIHPLREDPFQVFASYATCILDDHCIVEIGPNAFVDKLKWLLAMPMNAIAADVLCTQQEIKVLLDTIENESPLIIGDLLQDVPRDRHAATYRTLGWLAKMDAIQVSGLRAMRLD